MADQLRVDGGSELLARGAAGGGLIQVGGSWQNQDPAVRQATLTSIDPGAVLDASAINRGDGGTIVVWSDTLNPESQTTVAGQLFALGGITAGDGGRIETSGASLKIGDIDVQAWSSHGDSGLWLLDPYNYVIDSENARKIAMTLEMGANVTISTEFPNVSLGEMGEIDGVYAETGDIVINSEIKAGGDTKLALIAKRNIELNVPYGDAIVRTGNGSVDLKAGTETAGDIIVNSGIRMTGDADLRLEAGGSIELHAKWAGFNDEPGYVIDYDGKGSVELIAGEKGSGDITVDSGIRVAGDARLKLEAAGDIVVNAHGDFGSGIDYAGHNSVDLNAGTAGDGDILLNSRINAAGDSRLVLKATGDIHLNTDSGKDNSINSSGESSLVLRSGTGGVHGGGNIVIGRGDLLIDQGGISWYEGEIIGDINLFKDGAGTLTLSGSNAYGGDTTISAGDLVVNTESALGRSNLVRINGGVLHYGIDGSDDGLLSYELGEQGGTIAVEKGKSYELQGSLGGGSASGGLTKQGKGKLTLSGINTYGGDTTISAGELVISSESALGQSNVVEIKDERGWDVSDAADSSSITFQKRDDSATLIVAKQ
ncbi:MAG TPA: autotransporter-associated beta strand repeat-containing protein, partial [Prochlorococcaceae cyanobacterium Fu_MAG_50]|nr:autotransporter-associated beta strand repeat-containing protein [Prochlorococcaceae cyanobacterium Fu_MAG_50]